VEVDVTGIDDVLPAPTKLVTLHIFTETTSAAVVSASEKVILLKA
jgi:hypothetical protein